MVENKDTLVRTKAILGSCVMKKLKKTHVVILGLGGVGSFCVTSLARVGIEKMTLVDFDIIEATNINRQEFAFYSTIGMKKIDAAKKMLTDINPNIDLQLIDQKVSQQNTSEICGNCDFIVDAIDDIAAKISVALCAQENNVPIISCLGTALRVRPDMLQYADLYDTHICPFSKQVRKEAKKAGIQRLPVVFSSEIPVKSKEQTLGSVSYVPSVAGHMLAAYVINSLAKDNK